MKIMRILSILLVSAAVLMFAGCQQQQQLKQCQQENDVLNTQIEDQQGEIEKIQRENAGMEVVITELIKKLDKLKAENNRLKGGQNSAKPAEAEKPKNIQKGLQELFRLRQEAAEKLQKQDQK